MKLSSIRTVSWANSEKSTLHGVAVVEMDGADIDWPFAVSRDYDTLLGQEIWDRVNTGEFGPIGDFTEPVRDPVVTVLAAVTLWERMTEAEAEQVSEVMATQPFRTRKIFETAATFRSDHELWPLLEQIANQLFGAGRAEELLAA